MKLGSDLSCHRRIATLMSALGVFAMGILLVGLSHVFDLMTAKSETKASQAFYIPPEPAMRYASIGHRSFLASMLWIRGMIYYADALIEKGQPTLLAPLLRSVVFLDSTWQYPYEFAGLVLEEKSGVPSSEGLEFLRKGVDRFPKEWRLRLFLAMGIRARDGDPAEVEAVLLPIARGEVASPEYVRPILFTMAREMSDARRMIHLISDLARTTDDPLVAVTIQGKIESIIRKRIAVTPFDPSEAAEALFVLLKGAPPQVGLAQEIMLGLEGEATQRERAIRSIATLSHEYHLYKNSMGRLSN